MRAPIATAIPGTSEPSSSISPVWSPQRTWIPSEDIASPIVRAHL